MITNFRTYNLAVNFYHLCAALPVKGELKNQLQRASSSIVLNLAEGRGRLSRKNQRKFFIFSLGSLRECQAVLNLSVPDNIDANKAADILGAHLYKLIKSMN